MSHSQFHSTSRLYLDMHGLIFETSIWLLAGSTRLHDGGTIDVVETTSTDPPRGPQELRTLQNKNFASQISFAYPLNFLW